MLGSALVYGGFLYGMLMFSSNRLFYDFLDGYEMRNGNVRKRT